MHMSGSRNFLCRTSEVPPLVPLGQSARVFQTPPRLIDRWCEIPLRNVVQFKFGYNCWPADHQRQLFVTIIQIKQLLSNMFIHLGDVSTVQLRHFTLTLSCFSFRPLANEGAKCLGSLQVISACQKKISLVQNSVQTSHSQMRISCTYYYSSDHR